jgi:hypothetical protein
LVLPFIILARRENAPSDPILADAEPDVETPVTAVPAPPDASRGPSAAPD